MYGILLLMIIKPYIIKLYKFKLGNTVCGNKLK